MNIDILFNGTSAHQPSNGIDLQNATSHHPEASVRQSLLTLPRVHGIVPTGRGPVFDAATVGLEWLIRGTSETELRTRRAYLVGLLQRPGLLYQHKIDGVVRECAATLVHVSEPGEHYTPAPGNVGMSLMRMTARVHLTGVFLRDTTYAIASAPIGTTALTTWASSGPIPDAVVRFAPGGDVSIIDTAWGEGVSWSGFARSGYLYVDAASWTAWDSLDDDEWTPAGGDYTPGLSRPAAGRLQLRPVGESRTVTVTVTGANAAIRARGAWL